MIAGLLWLVGCQLAGEVVVRALDVPVPGAVAGLVLLLVVLRLRSSPEEPAEPDGVERVADVLLAHLQLFFVPAGVGVVVYLGTLRHDAIPLAVAVAGSWLLGLACVGWILELAARRAGRRLRG